MVAQVAGAVWYATGRFTRTAAEHRPRVHTRRARPCLQRSLPLARANPSTRIGSSKGAMARYQLLTFARGDVLQKISNKDLLTSKENWLRRLTPTHQPLGRPRQHPRAALLLISSMPNRPAARAKGAPTISCTDGRLKIARKAAKPISAASPPPSKPPKSAPRNPPPEVHRTGTAALAGNQPCWEPIRVITENRAGPERPQRRGGVRWCLPGLMGWDQTKRQSQILARERFVRGVAAWRGGGGVAAWRRGGVAGSEPLKPYLA